MIDTRPRRTHDRFIVRVFLLAALALIATQAPSGQPASVLHVKVMLVDSEGQPKPVPRHALLISENPASAAPRKVVTGLDGTVDVTLRPGNYTVESDRPVALGGKAYQWTQAVDVAAGRDTNLELTVGNAEVGAAAPSTSAPRRRARDRPVVPPSAVAGQRAGDLDGEDARLRFSGRFRRGWW